MKIISSKKKLKKIIQNEKNLGFIPTMGAIHKAHEKLIMEAKRNADIVLATIFVNPMQFGKNEDFNKYPKLADR